MRFEQITKPFLPVHMKPFYQREVGRLGTNPGVEPCNLHLACSDRRLVTGQESEQKNDYAEPIAPSGIASSCPATPGGVKKPNVLSAEPLAITACNRLCSA